MAHSNRKTRSNGQGGTTRNQQRKAEYAKLAEAVARKGGGSSAVSGAPAKPGRATSRTNHKPGLGKNGATHGQQRLWKEQRRKDAEARKAISDKLNPQQRIAILDKRLGVGIGATKERAKLAALIANPPKFSPFGRNPDLNKVTEADMKKLKGGEEKAKRAAKQAKKESADKKAKS